MDGETDLQRLLEALTVQQREGVYVVAQLPRGSGLPDVPLSAVVTEEEGTTVVLRQADADDAGLEWSFPAAWLTLAVASSLSAVGLTAAVSAALAEEGIPCNVLAGAAHDHLLVPTDMAEPAIAALQRLAARHAPG